MGAWQCLFFILTSASALRVDITWSAAYESRSRALALTILSAPFFAAGHRSQIGTKGSMIITDTHNSSVGRDQSKDFDPAKFCAALRIIHSAASAGHSGSSTPDFLSYLKQLQSEFYTILKELFFGLDDLQSLTDVFDYYETDNFRWNAETRRLEERKDSERLIAGEDLPENFPIRTDAILQAVMNARKHINTAVLRKEGLDDPENGHKQREDHLEKDKNFFFEKITDLDELWKEEMEEAKTGLRPLLGILEMLQHIIKTGVDSWVEYWPDWKQLGQLRMETVLDDIEFHEFYPITDADKQYRPTYQVIVLLMEAWRSLRHVCYWLETGEEQPKPLAPPGFHRGQARYQCAEQQSGSGGASGDGRRSSDEGGQRSSGERKQSSGPEPQSSGPEPQFGSGNASGTGSSNPSLSPKEEEYYMDLLRLEKGFKRSDLRKAYIKASRELHPDKNMGKSQEQREELQETFKKISEAYEKLGGK